MAYLLVPGAVANVPACSERLALIRVEGEGLHPLSWNYELSILFFRVRDAQWVVSDPTGALSIDDLNTEQVVPLTPGTPYPDLGRPYQVRDGLGEDFLGPLRLQARALADLHGAVPAAPSTAGMDWRYADTSHPFFSQTVEATILADGSRTILQG